MKALVFHHHLAREAAAKLSGSLDIRGYLGPYAPAQLEEIDEPEPPAEGWVKCETIVSGLCGSDAKQILLNGSRDNPLTALLSFPHVLGHEVVARRTDDDRRVVLNPWLSCRPRGVEPLCRACAEGRYPWCRSFTKGVVPPALHIGNCAGASGAHAERFVAHEAQLFEVPEGVPDELAVLADPVSVSLRTILLSPPSSERPVLVYGSGTLALAAVALISYLYPGVEVWAATRQGLRASLALEMGAAAVLPTEPDALVEAVAGRLGVQSLVPWSGRSWLQDGPAVVYDTVGSVETVETALRLLDTGGTLVVSGVEPPARFEWTPLYFKELRIIGSNAFGIEEIGGVRKHAFEHYFDWVAAGFDLSRLITHSFSLDAWKTAVLTTSLARHTGAVKVLLRP